MSENVCNSHIFLQFFSYLTSLLMESLTTCILLYICNKYKKLIESLTTYILLYICNKYKRLIESLTTCILLYTCNKYKRLIESLTTCILLYICNKYKRLYCNRACFAHGQLYVAFSRARSANAISVKIDETPEQAKHRSQHYTKNVVLHHILLS